METQGGPKLTWSSLFADWMSSCQSPRACVSNALKLSWKKKIFSKSFDPANTEGDAAPFL